VDTKKYTACPLELCLIALQAKAQKTCVWAQQATGRLFGLGIASTAAADRWRRNGIEEN
jgi:hypothetical protein